MTIKELMKTDGVIKTSSDDSVATAVSKLHSSHDAAFVFDGKHYIGVINPYFSLVKNNRSFGDSLVTHFIYHPPHIQLTDSLERVVGLMIDSRIHYLPVMKDDTFAGVVSARRILKLLKGTAPFSGSVAALLKSKNKALVTVHEEDSVDSVINLFEKHDVSKLVVIDKALKLKGIMSYHDIVPYLIAPKEKQFKGEILGDLKVKSVAQTLVHTVAPDATLADCLEAIITREIGSVVIKNKEGFPVGIVTVRDLLHQLTHDDEQFLIELSTNSVSQSNLKILSDYAPHLERWMHKIKDLHRATMFVKEEKNGALFKVTFTVTPRKGKGTTYQEEGRNLLEVLKKINKSHSSKD